MGAPRFALRVQRGAFQLIDRADPRRADDGSLFAISDSAAVSSRFDRADLRASATRIASLARPNSLDLSPDLSPRQGQVEHPVGVAPREGRFPPPAPIL